jgi:cytoskeleton protein RodZ
MSEEAQAAAPTDGVTAGMLLRQAREAAGLHVATLAVALKVPVRKLEALEEDRYDQLSDAVFVRALASSVCRTLKVDPQPILDRLPQSGKPRLVQAGEGINAPFRAPGDNHSPGLLDQVTRPVGLAVVALLLASLVVVLLPTVRPDAVSTTKAEPVMPPNPGPSVVIAQVDGMAAPVSAAPAASVAAAPAVVAPTPTATTASSALPTAPAIVASAASAPRAAAVPASAATIAAASAAASATAIPAGSVVVFMASAPSWVQVTDARGTAVLRKLLEAGETAGATGALPLTVTVGSVQSTQVQVRGKPFDLVPVTRDNVARFEVK